MFKKIASLFSGGAMKGVSGIMEQVDGLSTSAEEKATIRASIINKVVDAQASVIVAEAKAGGITAKWRPYTMLALVFLVLCHHALFPMIAVMFPATVPVFAAMVLPENAWLLIQVGLGGYLGARTGEKLATIAMPLITAKQEIKKLKLGMKANKDK